MFFYRVLCGFFVSLIVSSLHLQAKSLETGFAGYKLQRRQLIERVFKNAQYLKIKLSPEEKEVNLKLQRLKKNVRLKYKKSLPSQNFILVKKRIEESELFHFLQKMPKGAVLHVHFGAMGDYKWIIKEASYKNNFYVYRGTDKKIPQGALAIFNGLPAAGWSRTVEERKQVGNPVDYDSELYKSITLQKEDLNSADVWQKFEMIFERIDRLFKDKSFLKEYIFRSLMYYAAVDHVSHIEIHSSIFLTGYAQKILTDVLAEMRETGFEFTVRSIVTGYRVKSKRLSDEQFRQRVFKHAMLAARKIAEQPDLFVGFDMVGDEKQGCPTSFFAEMFCQINRELVRKNMTLPLYLHDGESVLSPQLDLENKDYFQTNSAIYNNNMLDAYLLSCKRVGHGFSLVKLPVLMELYREKGIALEVCPISNQMLNYVHDLRMHPAVSFINAGLSISLSPDDPAIFQYCGVSHDFWEACMAWNLDLRALKWLAISSIKHSALNDDAKKKLRQIWERKWQTFIQTQVKMNQ
jgi:adenosine deaminase CECR1